MTEKKAVLFTVPNNRLKSQLFTDGDIAAINRRYHAHWNPFERELTKGELEQMLQGKDAVVTAWGTHPLSADVLDKADQLYFVGHTGGTVKWLVEESFFLRNIPIVNANEALAPAVSEYCLMVCLMSSWNIIDTYRTVKNGDWLTNEDVTDGLGGKSVGIVGYGAIAREFIRLLSPFDVDILVCSGHCDPVEARRAGFRIVSLEEALGCDIVSLHATLNEKTYHMLDQKKLSLIRNGATLINTGRAHLIDEDALMAELATGRFKVVLDVFYEEPLPVHHPLRQMDHVLCTPHIAGANRYWRRRQSQIVLEDMERCFSGQPLQHVISLEQYRRLTPV